MPLLHDLPEALCDASRHLDDGEWLRSLRFRGSVPRDLRRAAADGDPAGFGKVLAETLGQFYELKKGKRKQLLVDLRALWEETDSDPPSLAACLLSGEEDEELSGRIETILAAQTESAPDVEMLVAALWLTWTKSRRISPRTLCSLWRWTLQNGQSALARADAVSPRGGFAALRKLELQFLLGEVSQALKGGRKLAREASRGFRQALEAATDTDGTPQGPWLQDLLPSLACLGRVTLWDQTAKGDLWNDESSTLLEGLYGRGASLCSPAHMAFTDLAPRQVCRTFQALGAALGLPRKSGLRKLFASWERLSPRERTAKPGAPVSQWSLPEECHQSDWAEWASLRSGWSCPTDHLILAHHASMPAIDVLVRNTPLFRGEWSHRLSIDEAEVSTSEGWSCVCWFSDEEASFIELQQQPTTGVTVIRQALLLRQEQLLLLADSVRAGDARRIAYSRTLPLAGSWTLQQDSRTREAALENDRCRVRVFPLSAPQERLVRSAETDSFQPAPKSVSDTPRIGNGQPKPAEGGGGGGGLTTSCTAGDAEPADGASDPRPGRTSLYVATVFDWSPKRRNRPVDWTRLTVAEEGEMIPPSRAVAFRIRIGKAQWFLYHSLVPPKFPRTALGVHTSSETVFGRMTSSGDVETIVEVES